MQEAHERPKNVIRYSVSYVKWQGLISSFECIVGFLSILMDLLQWDCSIYKNEPGASSL